MNFGLIFRALRAYPAGWTPAEMASLDRLVAGGDDVDCRMQTLQVSVSDALAAMDAFNAALFDGLTDEEAMQLMADPDCEGIFRMRDVIAQLGVDPRP